VTERSNSKWTISIDATAFADLTNYCGETGLKKYIVASRAIKQYLEQKTAEGVGGLK
jgi:hypothetical protein